MTEDNRSLLAEAGEAFRQGRLADAEVCLRKAIVLMPNQAGIYLNLGGMLQIQGRNREAVDVYRQGLTIDPGWTQILPRLAKALAAEQKHDEAAKVAARVVEISPEDATARTRYGALLETLGLADEATEQFAAAMRLDPKQGYACYALSRMHVRSGRNIRPTIEGMLQTLKDPSLNPEQRSYLEYAVGKRYETESCFGDSMRHFDAANRVLLALAPARTEGTIEESLAFRIKNFDRAFVETNNPFGSSDETPIFVVGMMRSGTTLAEQILTSHPQIGTIGERRFWLDHRATVLDPPGNVVNPERMKQAIDEYLALAKTASCRRVVDRTPINYAHLAIIHAAFPNARIIHMSRNPVDTCLSIWTTPDAAPSAWGHDKRAIVEEYRAYRTIMAHWRSVIPSDRLLDIQYEELVENQEQVTGQMIAFCGLEWDDACLSPERNQRSVSTPSVWQVRQKVYRTSNARWKRFEPWLGEFKQLLD